MVLEIKEFFWNAVLLIFVKINFLPLQDYTEPELIAALKIHENEAYQYLYFHYRNALFAVVTQFIPNKETAVDVLQEVFVTVFKMIDRYDAEKGRLFTWLITIARNTSINTLRSRNYKSSLKNTGLENCVDNNEKTFEPDMNFIGLRKQVHSLKKEFTEVLKLCYFNGFTQQEIADSLQIPIGTVKTRLRMAIIELRKQFI